MPARTATNAYSSDVFEECLVSVDVFVERRVRPLRSRAPTTPSVGACEPPRSALLGPPVTADISTSEFAFRNALGARRPGGPFFGASATLHYNAADHASQVSVSHSRTPPARRLRGQAPRVQSARESGSQASNAATTPERHGGNSRT